MTMQETHSTHELNGVYKNTNTGVHFTATVDEDFEVVKIQQQHTSPNASFETEKDISSFRFNANITGAYKQIKTEAHETIEEFTELLKQPIMVRALDEFLTYEEIPLTADAIADLQTNKSTAMTETQADAMIQKWVEFGIVTETTVTDFDHDAYCLNTDNHLTDSLSQFHLNFHDNHEMFKESMDGYVTGFRSESEDGWFIEVLSKKELVKAIELLLSYPDDTITVKELVTIADVTQAKHSDVVQALLTMGVVSDDERGDIDMRTHDIGDVKQAPLTVTVSNSFLAPLKNGLYEHHSMTR